MTNSHDSSDDVVERANSKEMNQAADELAKGLDSPAEDLLSINYGSKVPPYASSRKEVLILPTLLTVGALLRERYLIKSVLGSGSGETIYLIKDQQVKSIKYSLFILKEIAGLDQAARYQFTYSGAPLRQIQHPALPHIHAIFNDDKRGCIYLVMDYIEGSDLETLRLQQPAGCFSWSELQPLCEPVFAALTYLHHQEQPLFHGNIKPTNILQSITGKVLLVNLGYVQATTPEMRKAKFASLSSNYLAPEQFEGTTDERSDVYGLGATLYTLLTGQAPADAHLRLARVSKRKSDPLQLASKGTPNVPQPLAEVLQKALALDPSKRFASVREFWQVLNMRALSNDTPVQVPARPATPIPLPAGPMGVAALPTLVKNPSNSTATPSAKSISNSPPRRALLPGIALLCCLLLVLIGVGTWAWATTHTSSPASRIGQQNAPGPDTPTPTSVFSSYPHMLGTYHGVLVPLNGTRSNFTLIINHQVEGQISGIFSSTQPDGTFKASGKIDQQGDINIFVVDSSGNAFLGFSGGFNGIDEPKMSTMGGNFYSCVPKHGATCLQDPTSTTLSGSWTLSFVSSAFK